MKRAMAGLAVVGSMLLATQALAVVEMEIEEGVLANYLDKFSSRTYSGTDGVLDWTSSWREAGEADGPGSGAIQVNADVDCLDGGCLVFAGLGGDELVQLSVTRVADLSRFLDADLSYDVRRIFREADEGDVGAILYVQVSVDGKTWKTLKNLNINATDGSNLRKSHGIDNLAGSKVAVRFLVEGSLAGKVLIDNVQIEGTVGISGTTTTTSTTSTTSSTTTTTSTTSTTSTTTTTTVPPQDDDDDATAGAGEGPPPDSGMRDSIRGIQAGYEGSLFGSMDDMEQPQVLAFEVSSDYLITTEVIESSWAWMAGLGAVIAWAVVSNMDRRRRKRSGPSVS